jgi:uncharacterized protein (DUF924 family)
MIPKLAQDLLDVWFEDVLTHPERMSEVSRRWFAKNPAFDALLQERFAPTLEAAAQELPADWLATQEGHFALILLLDQLSRNLFRGTPAAFAQDPQALALARQAVAEGWHENLHPLQRVFCYLPYEHSEDPADQAEALRLFAALTAAVPEADRPTFAFYEDYARKHADVIERFGRFPHRNAILGRESTPAEQAYLHEPRAGF